MTAYTFAPYEPARYCTHSASPGSLYLAAFIEEQFRQSRLLNIESCRDIVGGSSLSHHAEGRANDEGVPQGRPASGISYGFEICEMILPYGKQLGIDHAITNLAPWQAGRGRPRSYSAGHPQGVVYTGLHPHKDHNHFGLNRYAAARLTLTTIRAVVLGEKPEPKPQPIPQPVPPSTLEDVVPPITKDSPQEAIRFVQLLINDVFYDPNPGILTNGIYGDGMEGTVRKWLLQYTSDTAPAVVSGKLINAAEYKGLLRAWILKVVKV